MLYQVIIFSALAVFVKCNEPEDWNKPEDPETNPSYEINYKIMQYAPLKEEIYKKHEYTRDRSNSEYEILLDDCNDTEETAEDYDKKVKIEPRVNLKSRNCSLNRNKDMSSVNRSPGLNAVYSNSLDVLPEEKTCLVHDDIKLTKLQKATVTSNLQEPNKHIDINPIENDGYNVEVEKIKRQPSSYTKLHRLHLNLAKVHNPKQETFKTQVFGEAQHLNKIVGYPRIPDLMKALAIRKTLLFPISDRQVKHRKQQTR